MTDYTFQSLDSAADGNDRTVSQALVRQIQRNTRAARERRLPGVSWASVAIGGSTYAVPNQIPRPEISSFDGWVTLPGWVYLLPEYTEITVKVRGNVNDEDVHVGVAVVPWERAQRSFLANAEATLSPSVTDQTATITVDVSGMRGGWHALHVLFKSDLGTYTNIVKSDGKHTAGEYISDPGGAVYIPDTNTAFTASQVDHYVVEPFKHASGDHDPATQVEARQVLMIQNDATVGHDDALFVYPTWRVGTFTPNVVPADDSWRIARLGHIVLHGVNIVVTGITPAPPEGALLDAGQPMSLRMGEALNAANVYTYLNGLVWHQWGPTPSDAEDTPGLFPGEPIDRIGQTVEVDDSAWVDVATVFAGNDARHQLPDGSTNLRRDTIDVCAWLLMHHFELVDTAAHVMEVRLQASDWDGSNTVTGDTITLTIPGGRANSTHLLDPSLHDHYAYLAAFAQIRTGTRTSPTPSTLPTRHVFRGVWPVRHWSTSGAVPIRLQLRDTSTGEERIVTLQIKCATSTTVDGTEVTWARWATIMGLGAATHHALAAQGEEIGS